MRTRLHRIIVGASVASAFLGTLTAGTAAAAAPPVSTSSVLHLDLQAGQMPENIVPDRHGSVTVTFAGARQVARITAAGRIRVLATLPAPADTTARTPLLGFPLTTGLVREGHTFYVLYATGTEAETGVWTFTEGHRPRKFADLPADGLPNGLAMDPGTGTLYVTDSAKGAVYSVPTRGRAAGRTALFSDSDALAPTGFFGVNGAKIHDGDLYVSNLDKGTVLRTPLSGSRAGTFTVFADGLKGIDDFEFTGRHGRHDEFLASLVTENTVVLADGRGARRTVLTRADGLSNPTSIAIRGSEVYVPSAAYTTQSDPNVLFGHLSRP
ncbi:hypothetical protein [Streptomyces sp. NPDC047000]|uniref:hypothetical protein n=1 Tax=Streptomyces sp. NPDC047000 TaxID=3155474 RepID=UPI0033E021DC